MHNSYEHYSRLKKILEATAQRVKERVESLDPVFQFKTGIEGWFKVEFVFALKRLGETVVSLKNKGPDVILTGGLQIELKAASDFNPSYLRDGALKDNVPCIFLGGGEESRNIERLQSIDQIHIIDIILLSGYHKWAVGCIIPVSLLDETKRKKSEELNQIEYQPQEELIMSKKIRNLNPSSPTMAGRLDEILALGGTWDELIAKVIAEAKKMNNKIHYTKSVLKQHIKYRRVDQNQTEYLRNMIINDEGIFPKTH